MEFVLHPTLPSQIILGARVAPGVGNLTDQSQAQQVLVAIVKSTFAADDPSAIPLPADQQLPVFLQDVFFNVVRNGNFVAGPQVDEGGNEITPVAAWESEGPTISQTSDSEAPHVMQVQGAGRVVQTLTFVRPLRGRTFRLRFRAKADTNVSVSGIQVESASGVVRFGGARTITSSFITYISAPATWPADLEDAEAKLVLVGSDSTTIKYDEVQLTEGSAVYAFDSDDPVRYEHDLAIYKPRTDIVVLGAPAPPDPGPVGPWTERVVLNGDVMSDAFSGGTRFTFGWQSRVDGPRLGYFGNAGAFDPETMQLPMNFNNRFFNGGLYKYHPAANQPVFAHPPPGAAVTVEASAEYDVGGGATETRTRTHRLHLPDPGPQAVVTYRTSPALDAPTMSQALDMNVDTMIYDKDTGQFCAVWRGVWDYASVPADHYVSLVLS